MVAQAGERLADVYVGVDVFARSNVIGGRFETDKVGGGLHVRAAGLHALCGLCLGDLPFSLVPQRKPGHPGPILCLSQLLLQSHARILSPLLHHFP